MVHLESIFIISVIDAKEKHNVAIIDLPSAFLPVINPVLIHMVLHGNMAELMAMIEPHTYHKFISHESGHTLLYVELMKAINGMLKSAIFFCMKLWQGLKRCCFEWNPYDPCITNATVEGTQMMVT